jgi:hypothetical protein
MPLICPTAKGKYFCQGGLDDPNHVDFSEEIGLNAQAGLAENGPRTVQAAAQKETARAGGVLGPLPGSFA